MDTNYQDFSNAIVMQAVKDYRKALHNLTRHPNHVTAFTTKRGVERFFRSGWYACLTQVDPEVLISRLKGEAAL